MKKEDLFVAVKTCKKFHTERGASPPLIVQKHFSVCRFLLKCSFRLWLVFFLNNGWFSFVILVCLK